MKKCLLILGMITCVLGLTACGSQEKDNTNAFIDEETAIYNADQILAEIIQIEEAGQVEQVVSQNENLAAIFSSWESAQEDLGDYKELLGHKVVIDDEKATITISISGTNVRNDGKQREAEVVVIFSKDMSISSVTTNVIYTRSEQMAKAGLNTLLGMGTVFVILILIMFIIMAFGLIPKLQEKFSKKKKSEEKAKAVDQTIAQIIEHEELSEDEELVAVIAAAIAASEGASGTDGFVVRSIRRANTNKWQRA